MKPVALLFAVAIALIPMPARASWTNFTFVDEWGEDANVGAGSAWTAPVAPWRLYEDLKARLFVDGCDQAWIRFTEVPNLTGGDIGDDYTTYSIKVRINGKEVTEPMIAIGGREDLYWISGDAAVIRGWANEESYAILVPLYGGSTAWKFDMTGAKAAIAKTCPDTF